MLRGCYITCCILACCILGLILSPRSGLALDAALGKALFDRHWVAAPASTDAADGLGPLYNARACASCHPRAGRGSLTIADDTIVQSPALVMRLAAADQSHYGRQLQTRAIPGLVPEGKIQLRYSSRPLQTPSGEQFWLRSPSYRVTELAYGPLSSASALPRLAPAVRGLGWVARIPGAAILHLSDPDDRDNDGISGRPNWLQAGHDQAPRLGRYGWKADAADLSQQTARALLQDMGLSSPQQPSHAGDCTPHQVACLRVPHGAKQRFDNAELSAQMVRLLVRYLESVPPPAAKAARSTTPGRDLFQRIGCAACHQPNFDIAERTIYPYSDFLLHDLGPGLADPFANSNAEAGEWRTAPLWGLGDYVRSTAAVALLHDGRARNVTEAILWHEGEAAAVRRRFLELDSAARAQLLQFVENL